METEMTPQEKILALEIENARLKEFVEEIALPPHIDSDLNSLLQTLRVRAILALTATPTSEVMGKLKQIKNTLELTKEHLCDCQSDGPCSQMWFQDNADEALAILKELGVE